MSSCAPLYIPNNVNTPLLSEENEVAANIGISNSGVNTQIAYAFTDKMGILLNGAFLSNEKNSSDPENFSIHKFHYGEFAIGYFENPSKNLVVEGYFGAGLGNSASSDYLVFDHDNMIYGEGSFYKLFLQGDVGVKGKFAEAGVALRTAYVNFENYEYKHFDLTETQDAFFMEPSVFLRLGGPMFKFQAQVGGATKLSRKIFVMYDPFIVSFGVILRINSWLKN